MNKPLKKSRNKVLSGVCAGIADYFGWDVTLVRVAYTFLTIFTAFSGILAYIVMAIVMPEDEIQ